MQKLDKVMSYLLEQMPPPNTLRTTIANLKNDIAIWEDKLKHGTDKEKQLARLILPDKREQLRRSLMVARDQKEGKLKKYPQTQYVPPRPGTPPDTPTATPTGSAQSTPPITEEEDDTDEDTQGTGGTEEGAGGTEEEGEEEEGWGTEDFDIDDELEKLLGKTPEPGSSTQTPVAGRTRSHDKKPEIVIEDEFFDF